MAQGASLTAEGTWQGTLHTPDGHSLRTVLKVSKAASGALAGEFFSIDQGGQGFPVSSISFVDNTLKYAITPFDLTYEGKMAPDGNTVSGNSTQGGNTLPLSFERATPATAWEIPKPPPPIKPMDPNANPSFDVATIKPSNLTQPGKGFQVNGRHFATIHTSFVDLVTFAYGVHPKQLINLPDWASTDRFDIASTPDAEGAPSDKQWRRMLQKLLAERFQFKYHNDNRELAAYALSAAKTGAKLEESQGDPQGLPGLWFSAPGNLHVNNANMEDFSHLMQEAVLDRPVVDQTNLQGRWNFNLKWTPDETQFVGMGFKLTPPKEGEDAPPPLFTAMPEQIGLRLDATRLSVPVMVVDHVARPTEN